LQGKSGRFYSSYICYLSVICKQPNYDFCISQGSVATVLRWVGQNYSHLRHVSSWRCTRKIIKSQPVFYGVIRKTTLAQFFFWDTVYTVFEISLYVPTFTSPADHLARLACSYLFALICL